MAANMENLPEHLLLDILTLVPASELICNCRLVCSHWRDLVDLPVLWKRKFQKRDHDSSPKPLSFYIFSRLKKNLIKNPDGQGTFPFIWERETLLDRDLNHKAFRNIKSYIALSPNIGSSSTVMSTLWLGDISSKTGLNRPARRQKKQQWQKHLAMTTIQVASSSDNLQGLVVALKTSYRPANIYISLYSGTLG
uniref:F-box domain-containing protein n=1 Tax=Podarcis muralis TaxID=64176 RepID=A0A670JLY9_PODMU